MLLYLHNCGHLPALTPAQAPPRREEAIRSRVEGRQTEGASVDAATILVPAYGS
ncbi:MAG: hypothetical protein GX182_06595 [Firmicutes bacterium]|nr:hypothetical protein [Bacillota bacterium]